MPTEFTRGLADGEIERGPDGRDLIRFERRLLHPPERVWSALTEPEGLLAWWGEASLDLRLDGRFALRWLNTDDEGNAVHFDGSITRLQAPRLLELAGRWRAEGTEGDLVQDMPTILRFELDRDRGATVLRFFNTLELSEDERSMVPAGWHYHLDALATSLDGGTVDLADPWAAWEPLHRAYEERYGEA
jgi:uncharacterized protein YndB with AHSA1/START domain